MMKKRVLLLSMALVSLSAFADESKKVTVTDSDQSAIHEGEELLKKIQEDKRKKEENKNNANTRNSQQRKGNQ